MYESNRLYVEQVFDISTKKIYDKLYETKICSDV